VVAQKILKTLEEPIVVDGQSMDLNASIGIARFPEHGEDANALLRAADVAMYNAKRNQGGFAVYDSSHDERRQEFLTLLSELRRAVETNQLVLHYQPKVSLADNRVTAVEALVRWQHPERGFVPPQNFIPFAEQTGYISAITEWVLRRATQQCGEWHRAGLDIRVSINVSARDLRQEETLVRLAEEALAAADVPAGLLCLEITESGLMEDPRGAQSTLRKLRELGIAASIDDYGTGYSSLSYIKQLAVNELKIDRTFVSGMEADHSNAAIVRSTIELGHNLGLTVAAEGVETDHEAAVLRRYGCDLAQGYHFARPMPAEVFIAWLAKQPGHGGLRLTRIGG
jgi:EAL domain-containing protein (putative c-di-GMP-specific phosphodiesterase class I)